MPYHGFVLEDSPPRPLADMPAEVLADMETSEVSIFAVKVQQQRIALAHADDRRRQPPADAPRAHGQHQPQIMLEGMRADFDEVDRISQQGA